MTHKGFTTAQVEALRCLAEKAPPSARPATSARPTTIPTIKSTHECDLPPDPEHGRFDQCSLCGQWYRGRESGDFPYGTRRHRRPRWWAETVLSHRERKDIRLNRRDDKKIARHQASKEATT